MLFRRRNRNKYNAQKTVYNGQRYDSAAEANRAAQLDLLVRAGKIRAWFRGKSTVVFSDGGRERTITFTPDFIIHNHDDSVYAEDVKGLVRLRPKMGKLGMLRGRLVLAKDFRLRAILWEARFPEIPIKVVDANGNVLWQLDHRMVTQR
jgi:hypothetical protein